MEHPAIVAFIGILALSFIYAISWVTGLIFSISLDNWYNDASLYCDLSLIYCPLWGFVALSPFCIISALAYLVYYCACKNRKNYDQILVDNDQTPLIDGNQYRHNCCIHLPKLHCCHRKPTISLMEESKFYQT